MHHKKLIFDWDDYKNEKLILERDISFEVAVKAIANEQILDIIPHPNQSAYSEQSIYILNIDGYAYFCPFEIRENTIHLITLFRNRKATKHYLGEKND